MSEIDGLVSSLHDHLEATERRPLTDDANRVLGEAQAIAADVDAADLDYETTQQRVREVLDLLEELEGTGDDEADEHVSAARRAAQRVLDR